MTTTDNDDEPATSRVLTAPVPPRRRIAQQS